ncbi:Secreted effector protein PipB2 [Nymphon striatum]|nr:Secreted effector protein PipB2 [Nymphon striatum]
MEDKKGSEQIYIHAEKNQDNIVENNETTDVGHNRTEKVGNDEDITIGNNRTEKVGVNEDITIGANRTEKVGANEDITIAANRTENVGANETIMIGANQTQTIGANQTRTIGANHTQTIGANQVQSIAGTQTEVIAGTLLQTVAGGVTVVTPATYTLIATGGYTLIAPSSDSIFKAFDSAITGAKFEVVGSANGVTGSKIEATGMAVGYTGAKIENETTKFKNSVVELSVFYKVFGPFVKRNSNEKVILDEGTIYQAKVLTLVDTGGRQERHPEVTLTLEMRPQQGTPFEVEITTYVSVYQLSKLVPGSIITLKYDPKFPDSAVIKPLKLGVLTRCFEFNGKFHMGVSILAFMPLAEKKPSLLSETSMWKFTSEQLGQDSVLEAGIPKARPEFLVTGKAFTPNEDLKQGLPVKVKLGKQEKELLVFGDRFWDGDSPSEIKPFTEMPIDWQHAFGGNEFGQNPLGKGYSHIVENGVKVKWIPNIQSRQQQITSFDSKPEPVSYGPIDVMWPQRMSLQGTYDEEWTKKYYPGFPPDIDWGYFNLASKDQQFTEKLDGDEQYSIENMNAQHPLIEGNLPNIKACCFVTQKIEDDEVFEEVKTNLRTVWFFPNDNRAVLVFQGSIEVKEEDAADILHLIASAENRGEARSLDHYQKVLKQRLDKKKGGLYALQDSDLLPENLNTQDPDVELAEKQLEPSDEQKKKLDILKPKQEKELKALCKEQGLDYNEVQEQIKQSDWKPPELVAEIQLEGYQQKKQELELEGASSEEIKQKIGESKSYEDYVLKEREVVNLYRLSAHLRGKTELQQAKFQSCLLTNELILAGANLEGADLSHTTLEGVDCFESTFLGATLHSVVANSSNFQSADMSGADLSECKLEGSLLDRSIAIGSMFTKADLTGASMSVMNLMSAILTWSNISGANLSQANLYQADLARIMKIQEQPMNPEKETQNYRVFAEIECCDDEGTYQIHSEDGTLTKYKKLTHKHEVSTIKVQGGLTLRVEEGGLQVQSESGIDLSTLQTMSITSEQMDIRADEGNIYFSKLSYLGQSLVSKLESISIFGGIMNFIMDTVIQKSKTSHRVIEDSDYVKSRHINYQAKHIMQMHGKNTLLTAEELIKLDGDQIHLG